jgi:selenocysteine lyase/cysteine desulfurase
VHKLQPTSDRLLDTKVLTVHNEFTSVTFPFAAQRHRGITVTEVKPAELLSQLRGHDLVAVSAVQSADGAGVDLDEFRTAAEAAGARVLVDVRGCLKTVRFGRVAWSWS